MRNGLAVLTICLMGAMAHGAGEDSPGVPLFNGKDLSGWKQIGGGKWSVDNGEIVGETGDGSYGWLVTEKMYTDFVLDLNFKIEAGGNSGIQFRSHVIEGEMHGYQAELDPDIGDHTGGVYEEHGRGWLAQPKLEDEKAAIKQDEWNHYRIQMIGDHVQLFINGHKMTDFRDSRTVRGIIALQVHSGKEPPVKVRWKDIAIVDLGYGAGWEPLFNGKDLDDWTNHGEEKWYVEDGAIVGQAVTDKYGYLSAEGQYGNFEMRLKFMAEGTGNSGVFYHSFLEGVDITGVQCEVDPTPGNNTGGFYESGHGGRGWLIRPGEMEAKLMNPVGEWNELQFKIVGNRMISHLNGYQLIDFVDKENKHTMGLIALQLHSGGRAAMRFRDLYVRTIE